MIPYYSQTIKDTGVKYFEGISGYYNQAHLDEKYTSSSRFKKRIHHSLLSDFLSNAWYKNPWRRVYVC